MNENVDKYKDIIELPHHESAERKHMPLYDRAAQFAPFAALTGFDDDVEETERVTADKAEISEDRLIRMDERLNFFLLKIREQPEVEITVFEADDKKEGGCYKDIKGRIKKYDENEKKLYFIDGRVVALDSITHIYGMEE
ncbi:MAG: hypothetical protein K6F63_05595 [Lachnospiraceae bacterium]|nr:hypothetical protein [Lachnospiraceae bacterium]